MFKRKVVNETDCHWFKEIIFHAKKVMKHAAGEVAVCSSGRSTCWIYVLPCALLSPTKVQTTNSPCLQVKKSENVCIKSCGSFGLLPIPYSAVYN